VDILIFAVIAAFLVYRLHSVLGSKPGNDERQRPNPFSTDAPQPAKAVVQPLKHQRPVLPQAPLDLGMVDTEANKDGRIETGLADIITEDASFEINSFMQGARYAFEMVVTSYAKGDLHALQPLLSDKLYGDFKAGVAAREQAGHVSDVTIHRIKSARLTDAHMGGLMAYITVSFEVEETSVTRDRAGAVVSGNPDEISTIEDVWTFTRDVRSPDPNWILIETKAVDK
jgi:predicted lipid-binding transport protein (Tim44 family)